MYNNQSKIVFLHSEMDTKPNTFGHPGARATDAQKRSYSGQMHTLRAAERADIDLVMIDGRFRVACCLKCFALLNDACNILFDDFLDRPHYHIVLDYFDITDRIPGGRMVLLRKRKDKACVPAYLIQKYELVHD